MQCNLITRELAEVVNSLVGPSEQLAQLAEECAELGQAALKLRRAWGSGNPTPVTVEAAIGNLREEAVDVAAVMAVLGLELDEARVTDKLRRWLERLEGVHDSERRTPPDTGLTGHHKLDDEGVADK